MIDEKVARLRAYDNNIRLYRDAAFIRAEGVGLGPEQRKLALETALADVSALKAA
jgi:hypothetical protein